MFADKEKAAAWLNKPQPALGGMTLTQFSSSEAGCGCGGMAWLRHELIQALPTPPRAQRAEVHSVLPDGFISPWHA
ncbi:antitoxin Xre/MbcA/ParS toxin-binding domain-containing protein [Pseudomonas sp. HLT2-19-2]